MVITNSRGDPVTVTKVVSNPSLIPGGQGGGASAFFRNKAAVAAVFAAVGLAILVILCLLICNFRSRHRRKRLAHDNAVAEIMEGRRSTGRLTLIDDDEDYGHPSSSEHSGSGHRPASAHSHSNYSNSSSNGRISPIDSAGRMASRTPFPPVSLLAASYNRRRSSSSYGYGKSAGGSGGRYQHLRIDSAGPNYTEFGSKSPSPPPRFSQDYHRDPFSDPPSVSFLLGTSGAGNRSPPHPAIMDEFEPIPPTPAPPIFSDSNAQNHLFARESEFVYDHPYPSSTSLNTGTSTPMDLEVRNVFDEELGSIPRIRRKPMLSVQNHP